MIRPLLSIVVTVYNTGAYLSECLDSIVRQLDGRVEVIIVDDGSTDDSGAKCDEYARKHDTINAVHTDNFGVSAARNLGLEKAGGDYVWFIDSDDVICDGAIKTLLSSIQGVDALIFGIQMFDKSWKTEQCFGDEVIDAETAAVRALLESGYRGYLPNKVFRLKIIKDNCISFNRNIRMCEDLLFCMQFFSKCKNVRLVDKVLYRYRLRRGSAMHSKIDKDHSTALTALANIVDICSENGWPTDKASALFLRAFYKYRPILTKDAYNKYMGKVKDAMARYGSFGLRDRLLIVAYKYANPALRMVANYKSTKGDLYD